MKKIKPAHLLILFIIIIIAFLSFKDVYIKNKIRKNGNEIIARFTSKVELPKRTNFYFDYFINNEKKRTSNSGITYSIFNSQSETNVIDSLKINSFYLAKYNPEYPEIIVVDPARKITDTIAILKAGFSNEDLHK